MSLRISVTGGGRCHDLLSNASYALVNSISFLVFFLVFICGPHRVIAFKGFLVRINHQVITVMPA